MNIEDKIKEYKEQIVQTAFKAIDELDEYLKGYEEDNIQNNHYYIEIDGTVYGEEFDNTAKEMRDFGNSFTNREFAEKVSEKLHIYLKLLQFKEKYDKDWEPNWEDENERKWCIGHDHEDKRWYVDCVRFRQHQGTIYFSTADLAEKAAKTL